MSALTSNEVTYENEGISETLTNTIDTLYNELKEYRTNGSVTSSEMLEGYTGYSKGKLISGSISSKGSITYTPGVNNQVITKGQYISEEQVILGDANLVSENIKEGKEIFGIKGSIKDNSGKTLEATNITSDDEFTYLNIPEGIYDNNSRIKTINSLSRKMDVFTIQPTINKVYEITVCEKTPSYILLTIGTYQGQSWDGYVDLKNRKSYATWTVSGQYVTQEIEWTINKEASLEHWMSYIETSKKISIYSGLAYNGCGNQIFATIKVIY